MLATLWKLYAVVDAKVWKGCHCLMICGHNRLDQRRGSGVCCSQIYFWYFEFLLVNMSRRTKNIQTHQSTGCVGIHLLFYNAQFNTTSHEKLLKKLKKEFEKVIRLSVSCIFTWNFIRLTSRYYTNLRLLLLDCLQIMYVVIFIYSVVCLTTGP
jgi:hypothetical protein